MPAPRRRESDQSLAKYFIPVALSVIGSLSVISVVGLWNLSSDVKVIKAAQSVSPVVVGQLQMRVEYLETSRKEILASHEKEMERLRNWMRNHTHGGQVKASTQDMDTIDLARFQDAMRSRNADVAAASPAVAATPPPRPR